MNFTQATEILKDLQDDHGCGLLEVMQYMQDNLDDFSAKEVRAYRVVFNEMSKLFAPA